MNAYDLARSAYTAADTPTRTDRGAEYALFTQITARMKAALAGGSARFSDLAGALHENRRLWSTLAADVAGAENGLPQTLRAQLFYLAEFTMQHSAKVLAGRADAEVLVEINTAMMRGLRRDAPGR